MWNLIKMDFYRLLNSRAFKVGAIAAIVVSAAGMLFSFGIVELAKYAFQYDVETAISMGQLLSQVGWVEGVDFASVILTSTSAFSLSLFIGCMLTANFIGSEQSCGYIKNVAGQLPNRGYMVISKFVVTSFVQLVVLALYAAVCSALAPVFFDITSYSIGALFAALGLRLLLHVAINAVIVFVCTFTKSHAIAMVVGSIFGIGITWFVYLLARIIFSALKINFEISDYMPDGINGQIALESVGTIWVKAVVVSVCVITASLVINYILVKKRDVK